MTNPLCADALRQSPQRAALALLCRALDVATVSLVAAHPMLECLCPPEKIPIDILADDVIGAAAILHRVVHRYETLLDDLDQLMADAPPDDDIIF